MPEATVYKYGCLEFREEYVWFAREIGPVETKSQTSAMQVLSHQKFRFCIFASNSGHHFAAL